MTSDPILGEIVDRILRVAKPEKIVLFGSRARGSPRRNSDYDILVVQRSRLPRHQRAGPFYAALADLAAEVEVMVFTPQEMRDWRDVPQAFVTTALREGKVIYERKG